MGAKVSHTPYALPVWRKTAGELEATVFIFFSPASPRLVSDSVKVAIEGRSAEQQADTFTPLISQHGPAGDSSTEPREGEEDEAGNLALYEASATAYINACTVQVVCTDGLSQDMQWV